MGLTAFARAARWASSRVALAAVALFACGSGETRKDADCGGRKVDLLSDRANCGACGTSCRFDNICDVGACKCLGTTCSDKCVDLATDETNCGACDKRCGSGEVCASGACATGQP